MPSIPSGKFLSLIPELHQAAVEADGSAIASTPASPEVKAVDPVEKTRRSSSSVSDISMPGDAAKDVGGMQFLRLGN